MAGKQQRPAAKSEPTPDALANAKQSEAAIGEEALAIRAAHGLPPADASEQVVRMHALALFEKLYPLCRRPIPPGFIVSSEAGTGKPYASTGVKSVQVLFDRMDNVFGPLWWRERVEYLGGEGERDGKPLESRVALVEVEVGPEGAPFFSRSSRGGVNQASTVGNHYKGSYTNAAKLAFARVGPGHEIYLGAADLDPDTDPDAAKAQAAQTTAAAQAAEGGDPIGPERGAKLVEQVQRYPTAFERLEQKLRGFGVKVIGELTEAQGLKLIEWAQSTEPAAEEQRPAGGDGGSG